VTPPLPRDSLRVLLAGRWSPGQVRVAWAESGRRIVPEVEAAIEAAWREANARPGVHLFDGPVCRLESYEPNADGTLDLRVSRTSYRLVVGTNFCNPHFADTFGPGVMANPIGVSAGLLSSDGYLLLGRRNDRVAYYPGRVHPFAGSLEVREHVDLFDDVCRELREELNLGDGVIAGIEMVALVEDVALRHPEAMFRVRTTLTRAEVEAGTDREEHDELVAVRATADELARALESPEFTPAGTGILRLCVDASDLSC